MTHIPGEGSTVTVIKNQMVIMEALCSILTIAKFPVGRTIEDIRERQRCTVHYLAECQRREDSAKHTPKASR